MSGVAIVIALIRADTGLPGMLATLKGEELEVGDALPAIGVVTISDMDNQPLKRGATRLVTERVQATVYAADATQRRAILAALKRAVADQVAATIGTLPVSRVSVLSGGRGPDFRVAESNIRGGSIDFMVSYVEAA